MINSTVSRSKDLYRNYVLPNLLDNGMNTVIMATKTCQRRMTLALSHVPFGHFSCRGCSLLVNRGCWSTPTLCQCKYQCGVMRAHAKHDKRYTKNWIPWTTQPMRMPEKSNAVDKNGRTYDHVCSNSQLVQSTKRLSL